MLGVCFAATSAACVTHPLELVGSGDASAADAGALTTHTPTSAVISTCPNASETPATLGMGFNDGTPAACDAPRGAVHAVSSPADVAALLVGLWYDCTVHSFGIDFGFAGRVFGVELTSDGRYLGYGGRDDATLVPLESLTAENHFDAGFTPTPSSMGTFTVVDGSATYGPGTYELQLHPANGGIFRGQVLVTDAPLQVHFLPPNAEEQVFVQPLPWSPRKGVCSCMNTTETASFEDDPVGLASAILGRWLWCAGLGGAVGNIGVEFAAGNTWYALNEDASGTVTRGNGDNDHGTFVIGPTPPGFPLGPEPLSINLNGTTQGTSTQVLFFANPRVLFYAYGTGGPGGEGGVGPSAAAALWPNLYSTLLPMP
jgi:hypothetical protein